MIGTYNAEYLMSGEGNNFEVSKIILKYDNISLDNKTYILITECNGYYYLIEKMNLLEKDKPKITYILREDQIIMAAIKNSAASSKTNISITN